MPTYLQYTKRAWLEGTANWDDLRFPATATRVGSLNKPDFDYTNLGLLFPQNDPEEKIYIIAQLPHSYRLGTELRPHIHYVQDEASVPTFKMDYRWYANGTDPTESFTTIATSATDIVFDYTSGSIMQILSFPPLINDAIDSVSSILDIILYREDNVVSGDVLVKEFDIHFQSDTLGSEFEGRK